MGRLFWGNDIPHSFSTRKKQHQLHGELTTTTSTTRHPLLPPLPSPPSHSSVSLLCSSVFTNDCIHQHGRVVRSACSLAALLSPLPASFQASAHPFTLPHFLLYVAPSPYSSKSLFRVFSMPLGSSECHLEHPYISSSEYPIRCDPFLLGDPFQASFCPSTALFQVRLPFPSPSILSVALQLPCSPSLVPLSTLSHKLSWKKFPSSSPFFVDSSPPGIYFPSLVLPFLHSFPSFSRSVSRPHRFSSSCPFPLFLSCLSLLPQSLPPVYSSCCFFLSFHISFCYFTHWNFAVRQRRMKIADPCSPSVCSIAIDLNPCSLCLVLAATVHLPIVNLLSFHTFIF